MPEPVDIFEFQPHTKLWGLALSLGLLAVGFADGLNSILTLRQFQTDFCKTPAPQKPSHGPYFPATIECIDERTYRVVYLVGSVLGPLLSGFFVADRFGRKTAVLVGALVFIAGCVWALATPMKQGASLIIARGVQGVGASMLTFAIPLLWVESVRKDNRGFVGAFLFLTLYLGFFLWSLVMTKNNDYYNFEDDDDGLRGFWRGLFLIASAFALVAALMTTCLAPQSPRWMHVFSNSDGNGDIGKADTANETNGSLANRNVLKVVAIGTALVSLQQIFCLSNLVQISDAMQTFARYLELDVETMTASKMLARGFSSNQQLVAVVVFIPALVSLCLLDSRVGRRRLLLVGAVGMGACHVAADLLLSAGCKGEIFQRDCRGYQDYYAMYVSMSAIFCYGFSWGPVCIIYPLEMFSTEVRARGFALTIATSTAIVMSIKEFWPELCSFIAVSIPCAVLAVAFVWFLIPETKKLSLEDTAALFNRDVYTSRSTLNVA